MKRILFLLLIYLLFHPSFIYSSENHYQNIEKERLLRIKKKLNDLKNNNPQAYMNFINKIKAKRLKQLQKIAKDDPHQFNEIKNHRDSFLNSMKNNNQNQFNSIKRKKDEFKESLKNNLMESSPELYKKLFNSEGSNLKEKMISLKMNDPDSHRMIKQYLRNYIQNRKENKIQRRITFIKENNPELYENINASDGETFREKVRNFRKNNPGQLKKFLRNIKGKKLPERIKS